MWKMLNIIVTARCDRLLDTLLWKRVEVVCWANIWVKTNASKLLYME